MSEPIKGLCIVDGCGAEVEIKTNKAGKFYYACNGNADPHFKACGSVITFGKAATQRMTSQLEKETPGETDNGPKDTGTGDAGAGKSGDTGKSGGAFW